MKEEIRINPNVIRRRIIKTTEVESPLLREEPPAGKTKLGDIVNGNQQTKKSYTKEGKPS